MHSSNLLHLPFRSNFAPEVPTIMPSPLMLPFCMVVWIFLHHLCSQGLPQSRLLLGINYRIGFFVTTPFHGTPHAFRNHFIHKKVSPYDFIPSWPFCRSLHHGRSMFLLCLLMRNRRNSVLVSHSLILSKVCMVQDQCSLPKEKTAQTLSTNLISHGTSLLLYIRISFQKASFADCILSSMSSWDFPCRFMA